MAAIDYAISEHGTVVLPSGYEARVTKQTMADGEEIIWVHGKGGAAFMLQRTGTPGVYAPLNLMTGSSMRFRGNEVRFVVLGGIVEVKR